MADFDDPFGGLDPLSGFSGGGAVRRRPSYRRPLPPDQSDDMMRQLTGHATSLLQEGAAVLDKPGRAVRGVLGGRPNEALAALPFSDTFGITDPKNRVAGRDLTNQWGITRRSDKGWGAWGAGLATDIATDPLTYLTLGAKHALTPAGIAARNAGTLKGLTRVQSIQQGLGGLAGIGLPFRYPSAVFGTGRAAQAVAGGLDKAGDFLRFGNPIGRATGALFDHSVNGATGAMTQRGWARHGTAALDAAHMQSRQQVFNLIDKLDPIIKTSGLPEQDILNAAIRSGEGLPHGLPTGFDPAMASQIEQVGQQARGHYEAMMAEARRIGLPLEDASDQFTKYMYRQSMNAGQRATQIGGHNLYPVASGSNIAREAVYRNVPGGQTRIDDWVKRFAGLPADPATEAAIHADMLADFAHFGTPLTPQLAKQFADHAGQLTTRMAALNPSHVADGVGLFSPDLARLVAKRGEQHARTMASAQTAMGIIGDNAKGIGHLGTDYVTIPEVLRGLGMKTWRGNKATGQPIEGALAEAYRRLSSAGAGPVTPFLGGKLKDLRSAAAQFGLTRQQYEELVKAHGKWTMPEVARAPIGVLDSFTNAFKNLTYPIWPASHVRNMFSAGAMNLTDATPWRAYQAQLGLMRDTATAAELRRLAPSMPAGLSDEAARNWVRGQQFSSGKIFGGHNAATDQAGNIPSLLKSGDRITPILPGTGRRGPTGTLAGDIAHLGLKDGLWDQAAVTGGKILSPRHWFDKTKPWGFGMQGVAGATADTMPALKAGRLAGSNVEDFFRGSNWLGNTEKGMTAAGAGERANQLHFDYDALTGFEKRWMKRLVPFYTFSRKNIPLQAQMLATRPGIAGAQMRLMNAGRGPDDYVPDYLGGKAAIPLGQNPDGTTRYVSSFGTPLEEAMERFQFKGGMPDARATSLNFLGTMNPLIKGPMEQLFNTQFHTGRKLSDLKAPRSVSAFSSMLGEDNPQLLAQVLANTPATRFLTAADKVIDERKPWWAKAFNLGSGVRITDVDADKQRAIEARRAAEELAARSPHLSSYTNFYAKPQDVESLSPEETQLLRTLSQMQVQAKAYVKQQRAAEGSARRIGIPR